MSRAESRQPSWPEPEHQPPGALREQVTHHCPLALGEGLGRGEVSSSRGHFSPVASEVQSLYLTFLFSWLLLAWSTIFLFCFISSADSSTTPSGFTFINTPGCSSACLSLTSICSHVAGQILPAHTQQADFCPAPLTSAMVSYL